MTTQWVENIHLRGSAAEREAVVTKLVDALAAAQKTPYLIAAEVFRHATIERDLTVRLRFDGPGPMSERSDVAEHLASSLEAFGSVKLSVWILAEKSDAEHSQGAV